MQVMQFTFVFTLLTSMIEVVSALPSAHNFSLFRRDCNLKRCVAALGPAASNCVGAAVQLGANPFADANCVASVLKDITNPPSTCVGCGAVIKDKTKKAGQKIKTKASSAKAKTQAGASSMKAGIKAKAQALGHGIKSKFKKSSGPAASPGTELSNLP